MRLYRFLAGDGQHDGRLAGVRLPSAHRIGHRQRDHRDLVAVDVAGEVPQDQAGLGVGVHHDPAARRHESSAGRTVGPVQRLAQRGCGRARGSAG